MRTPVQPAVALILLLTAVSAQAQPPLAPPNQQGPPVARLGTLRVDRDVPYTQAGGPSLKLDLYRRTVAAGQRQPVVIWFHGEDAAAVGKAMTPAARLVAAGYAVASVEYRSSAATPLHNAKAAVRWIRANAERYGLDADRIGVWGVSEGGEIAALLGTTADAPETEGTLGSPGVSSRVQAVVNFSGRALRNPARPNDKAMNPLTYVTANDAPVLLVHGTADTLVAPERSRVLQVALKRSGVQSDMKYVPGAGHSIGQTQTPAVAEIVTSFFDKHLRGGVHQRDDLEDINQPTDAWIDAFSDNLAGTTTQLFQTPQRGAGTYASYRLYLPPGYAESAKAGRRYPVIYYLHGANEDSGKAVNAGYVERLDAAIRTGAMPPTIVVVAQGLNRAWYIDSVDGKAPVESVFIRDLLPHIDKTYRTLPSRANRAIEGHSMGGAGALHMAFKYPELFGSVSTFASALLPAALAQSPTGAQGQANTAVDADAARREADGAWNLAVKNADKIRGRMAVRLICGELDRLLAPNQWMSQRLNGLGIQHEFIVSKGAPHSVKEVIARLDESPFGYYAKVFGAQQTARK